MPETLNLAISPSNSPSREAGLRWIGADKDGH